MKANSEVNSIIDAKGRQHEICHFSYPNTHTQDAFIDVLILTNIHLVKKTAKLI